MEIYAWLRRERERERVGERGGSRNMKFKT